MRAADMKPVSAVGQSGGAKSSRAMPSGSRKLSPNPYGAATMPPWATRSR